MADPNERAPTDERDGPGDDAMRLIERLRGLRATRERARPIGLEAEAMRVALEQDRRRLGAAASAWAEAAGAALGDLAHQTRPIRVSRGVLWVEAANASVRYRVSAWLRGGGATEVVRRSGAGRLTDVRVMLAKGADRGANPH
ncbi:MAG: hypothetical protein AAGK04_13975 [Planctomycetota bacterium]